MFLDSLRGDQGKLKFTKRRLEAIRANIRSYLFHLIIAIITRRTNLVSGYARNFCYPRSFEVPPSLQDNDNTIVQRDMHSVVFTFG